MVSTKLLCYMVIICLNRLQKCKRRCFGMLVKILEMPLKSRKWRFCCFILDFVSLTKLNLGVCCEG